MSGPKGGLKQGGGGLWWGAVLARGGGERVGVLGHNWREDRGWRPTASRQNLANRVTCHMQGLPPLVGQVWLSLSCLAEGCGCGLAEAV